MKKAVVCYRPLLLTSNVVESAACELRISPGFSVTRWNPLSSRTGFAELP